jgi:hypothetical protein
MYHVLKKLNWEVAVYLRLLVLAAEDGSFVPKDVVGGQHVTGMGMSVCVLL